MDKKDIVNAVFHKLGLRNGEEIEYIKRMRIGEMEKNVSLWTQKEGHIINW